MSGLYMMTASKQLKVLKKYPGLVPKLMRYGLAEEDAKAVAYNAALVYYALCVKENAEVKSPREVLQKYSLEEIARLSSLIQSGDAGFDRRGDDFE